MPETPALLLPVFRASVRAKPVRRIASAETRVVFIQILSTIFWNDCCGA